MNNQKIRKSANLLNFAIWYLVFFVFLGYVYKNTNFGLSFMVFVSFLTLVSIFGVYFISVFREIKVNIVIAIWIPYLLWMSIGYLQKGDIENFAYWIICFFLICLARKFHIADRIPCKLIYNIGIFFLVGIAVQILLPEIYYTYIVPIFTNSNQIVYWGRAYGYAGFSYQLDAAAVPLAYAEGVFLFYLWDEHNERNKWGKYLILGLFVVGIMLTGKRMMLLISVVVPIIVYFLSQKVLKKKILTLLLLLVFLCSVILFIYGNAELLVNNHMFRRIAQTFINLKQGADISTGRTELYDIAIEGFKNYPIFGIGVGNFSSLEGAYTATHNTYIQILCEQGVVGLLAFVMPLICCLFLTVKKIRVECEISNLRYLKLSLYIQILYIFYSMSANSNINLFGYIMYFFAISMLAEGTKKDVRLLTVY